MTKSYKVTGINLKSMPLGEYDRLMTILTPELGLIRVVAPSARKHKSSLGGRCGLFVVNELLIAKGRSLDKITQAQTLESYPGLGQNLVKLTASQYLAELVLCQALTDQPQVELFTLLTEHLQRLEHQTTTAEEAIAFLTHAMFHLLAVAGIAPQVQSCCLTQAPVNPDFTTPNWYAGFSIASGGVVTAQVLAQLQQPTRSPLPTAPNPVAPVTANGVPQVAETPVNYSVTPNLSSKKSLNLSINALELTLLQRLAQPELPKLETASPLSPPDASALNRDSPWLKLEKILRQYAQYHWERPIRAADLIDTCFLT